jgi:putative transposase
MKTIRPGQLVYWRNQPAVVLELKGFSDAILRTVDDGRTEVVSVADVTMGPTSAEPPQRLHLIAKDKEWDQCHQLWKLSINII